MPYGKSSASSCAPLVAMHPGDAVRNRTTNSAEAANRNGVFASCEPAALARAQAPHRRRRRVAAAAAFILLLAVAATALTAVALLHRRRTEIVYLPPQQPDWRSSAVAGSNGDPAETLDASSAAASARGAGEHSVAWRAAVDLHASKSLLPVFNGVAVARRRSRRELADQCAVKLVGSGYVGTPLYPQPLSDDRYTCFWQLSAVYAGQTVKLDLSDLAIAETPHCSDEYVAVADASGRVVRYCSPQPKPILAGENVYVWASSHGSPYGFRAGFTSVFAKPTWSPPQPACGGRLHAPAAFASPNYPRPYPTSGTCFWVSAASGGRTLTLSFDTFNVGRNASCTGDYVTVWTTELGLLGRFCGNSLPSNVTTKAYLFVFFSSDGDVDNASGFRARLTSDGDASLTSPVVDAPTPASPQWSSTAMSTTAGPALASDVSYGGSSSPGTTSATASSKGATASSISPPYVTGSSSSPTATSTAGNAESSASVTTPRSSSRSLGPDITGTTALRASWPSTSPITPGHGTDVTIRAVATSSQALSSPAPSSPAPTRESTELTTAESLASAPLTSSNPSQTWSAATSYGTSIDHGSGGSPSTIATGVTSATTIGGSAASSTAGGRAGSTASSRIPASTATVTGYRSTKPTTSRPVNNDKPTVHASLPTPSTVSPPQTVPDVTSPETAGGTTLPATRKRCRKRPQTGGSQPSSNVPAGA